MTNFSVSWKSAGKVNFFKGKVIKRRAWKTLNVISTLAIVLNTGMVGVFLQPQATSASTDTYCPSGNPLFMWDRTPSAGWSHGNISGYYEGEYIPVQLELDGLTAGVTKTLRVEHQYIRNSIVGIERLDHVNAPIESGVTFNPNRLNFTLGSASVIGSNPSSKQYTLTFTPTGTTATLYFDALVGPNAHSYSGSSLHVSLSDCGSKDVPINTNQILYHELEVTKTDNPDPIAVGSNTTYTIKVKNSGNTDGVGEQNVIVTDTLPPQLTYVPTASPAPTTVVGQVLTWNLGTISDGSTKTITLIAKGTVAGFWTNTASATSTSVTTPVTTPDGSETTRVTGGVCGLVVTKKVDKETAAPGDTLTYTITYENQGTGFCTGGGVHLYDELNGMTYVNGSAVLTSLDNNTDVNGGAPDAVEVFASTFTGKTTHKELANLHEIGPGEKGVLTFQTTVNDDTQQRCSWTVMNSGWTDGVETQSDVQFQSPATTVTGSCFGNLTVNKKVDANGDGAFEGGNTEANALGFDWGLDAGAVNRDMGTTATGLTVGSHDVTENSVTDYHFVGWYTNNVVAANFSCANPEGTTLPISVNVAASATKEITLCNARDTGRITFDKVVVGGTAKDNDFGFVVNDHTYYDGDGVTLPTDTYGVNETGPDSYSLTSASGACSLNSDHNIVLSVDGQGGTCTITNTRDLGRLLVKKNVLNPDGSEVTDTHAFTVTLDGVDPKTIAEGTSAQYPGLATGTYTVVENPDGDYDFVNYNTGGTDRAAGTVVTINKGETTVLTVTNKQKKATITISKDVRDFQGNDVTEAGNFSVTSNAGDFTIAEFDPEVLSVNPGTYTFTEGDNANYTIHSTNPKEITVGSNDEKSYTFENWQKPSSITVCKYVDVNGDGSIKGDPLYTAEGGWTMWLDDELDQQTVDGCTTFSNLKPGTYDISEGKKDGWEKTTPDANFVSVTVGMNDNSQTVKFGNFKLGKIWGYKYDTLQNPLADWQICLNGDQECTTTNADGKYEFTGLSASTYTVAETLQGGWWAVSPLVAGYIVDITSGSVEQRDFVNFHGVSVSGSKFNDLNGNGVWNEGEPGLTDWTIQLLKNDDGFDVVDTTTTDVNGNYSFGPLGPGDYRVREVQQGGWTQTTSNPEDFTAVSGQDLKNLNFGNYQYGRISGYKFNDINGNGQWDENEPKLNGWSICLNGTENCVVTGSGEWPTGYYEFTGLTANTYEVYEQLKDGWTQTMPGDEYEVVVTSGTGYGEYQSYNFGNYKYGRISGYKFDWSTEHKLDGWTICLEKQQPILNDQLTRVSPFVSSENCVVTGDSEKEWPTGYYEFTGLLPGTYKVYEHNQAGWTQVEPNNPAYFMVTVTSGTGYGEYNQYDFWNQHDTGRITFDKVVVGGTAKDSDFSFIVNDTTYKDGDAASFVTGTYGLTETGIPTGYELTAASGACSIGEGGNIVLSVTKEGGTCTITNTFPVLTLAKVADPVTVGGNQNVTYTITWSVAGAKAVDVTINDPVPANTTYVSATCGTTTGTCTMSTTGTPVTSATWALGTRNPGEGGTVTYTVKTNISVPNGTVIPNQAKISAVGIDPVYAAADVKATTAPQLQITKTANATIVNPGDPITYTVQVKNIGTDVAHNAVMSDTLPAGFTFVSTSPTAASIVGQTGTWNLGEMNVGDIKTITYTVNVAPGTTAGTYDNIAKAHADNAPEVSTLVPIQTRVPKVLGETTNPVLQLRKSVSKATVAPGDTVTYTVEIKNTGTGSAINVILTDLLPVGFTFKGTDLTTKDWKLGDIAIGETKTVSYKVTVGKSVPNGSYENLAIAQADNHGKVTTSVPVNVKRGRVLGATVNTGASLVDLGIAGVGLSLVILGFVLTRKRGEELA